MKTLLLFSALSFLSCVKDFLSPAKSMDESAQETAASVHFAPSPFDTVYLSRGRNTIKTGLFTVAEAQQKLDKFILPINGNADMDKLKFYINGGEIKGTYTFGENVVTIVPRNLVLQPGDYTYIIEARVLSGSFKLSLTEAQFDIRRVFQPVSGLPDEGNYLIVNN